VLGEPGCSARLAFSFLGGARLPEPRSARGRPFLDKTRPLDYLKFLWETGLRREQCAYAPPGNWGKAVVGMNIAIPLDEELELPFRTSVVEVEEEPARFEVVAADDGDDFDEDDFDDEFDDDFEEELEDEYELSEFEDVTEDDLIEGDDDLDKLGGDFVDEDAEPEEPPAGADDAEPAEGKESKEGKPAKDSKKKGKPAKQDEDLDDED